VPHLRRAGSRGDLHVFVNVVVPAKLSKRQRELLTEYASETGESVAPGGSGLREKLGLG
jgi:molecular chaperone DnaJ